MVLHLAWPTMLEQALHTMVSYADTAQVGIIGAQASAAVGLTSSTTWLVNAPLFAMGMGVLSCISYGVGANDKEIIQNASSQAVILTLTLGILMGGITVGISPFLPGWLGASADILEPASTYFFIICLPMLFRASSVILGFALRAVGETKRPLINNLIMNILNIVLNFLLINPSRSYLSNGFEIIIPGAGLGVAGAAIATAVSYVMGGTLMFISFVRNPQLNFKGLHLDLPVLSRCVKVGIPIAATRVSVALGHVLFTSIIARLGTIAIAAHSIAITAEEAFYIPGFGMQTAAATLSGYAHGERNEKKHSQYTSIVLLIAVGLMSILALLLYLFASQIMSLLTPDKEVIALGARVLRIVSISEPFYAASIIYEGVFNGIGYTKIPLLYSSVTMWCVRILFSFFCVFFWNLGLEAVWLCMISDNILRCMLLAIHYHQNRWKRKVGLSVSESMS